MSLTSSLRSRLLAALATSGVAATLGAPSGCGPTVVLPSGSTGGGGSEPTSTTSGSTDTGGSTTGTTNVGGGTTGTTSAGGGTIGDCYTNDVGTCCDYSACFTKPELAKYTVGGMIPADCPAWDALVQVDVCDWFLTGPTIDGDNCCYGMAGGDCCGRPFLVSGEARRAVIARRADWGQEITKAEPLDEATRAALARAWLLDARMEHASIASFARLTLHLLSLGAPPELIAGAQRASLDEIEHARACFALASRYSGEPVGPGPVAIEGSLTAVDLAEAAVSAVREGCVGETIAAALAAEQLAVTEDGDVRSALALIVRDEEAHAELSWRFVRWAIEVGGAPVREAVARVFSEILTLERRETSIVTETIDANAWHRHGRLTRAEIDRVTRAVRREVIAPCAQALLGLAAPPEERAIA